MPAEALIFPDSWRQPTAPGYGTFPYPFAASRLDYERAARGTQPHVEQALRIGYRHIDTAFTYGNQDLVGGAIRASGLSRQAVFVTSKLHPNNNTYPDAAQKIDEAISLLWGAALAPADRYLDAFLLHYPGQRQPLAAWKALTEARAAGRVRHVGVSNFDIPHLEQMRAARVMLPEINQIEFHPLLFHEQKELLAYCVAHRIAVEGYSPLAEGAVLHVPLVQRLAAIHHTTPARIALKWCLQHGVRPIVGTRNPEHLHSNFEPYLFSLAAEEMHQLDALGAAQTVKVSLKWNWNPKTAPFGTSGLYHATRSLLHRTARQLARLFFRAVNALRRRP